MGITPIYSIPFADPTDLVRDWPALSEDVAEAVESAISGVPVLAGIGSNAVQTVKTNIFTTTSTSFTDVTGLDVTITPSTDTSRILLIAYMVVSTDGAGHFRFTGGNSGTFIGDADGSRVRSAASTGRESGGSYLIRQGQLGYTIVYLDAPNTAAAVTYKVQARSQGANVTVNRSVQDTSSTDYGRTAATLTAIEVAP